MIYTLFFSRMRALDDEGRALYLERSEALRRRARHHHPGFVDIKTYLAEDGERLTVARFRDPESQRAWRLDPEHLDTQALGRSTFYERYRLVVCEDLREHGWVHEAAVAGETASRADHAPRVPPSTRGSRR